MVAHHLFEPGGPQILQGDQIDCRQGLTDAFAGGGLIDADQVG
jgi:hypothetical protein